jgi:hypothetical protein
VDASRAGQAGVLYAWRVMRQDDNGNRYLVGSRATRKDAEDPVAQLEARGHKQLYWTEPFEESAPDPPPGQ